MSRFALLVALLAACTHHDHIAVDGAVLGRVVVYRNGVAFYERRATVHDGKLSVHVPRERVDDFLKSLTVVDPVTRTPLSVSIPRQESDNGSYLTMTLETADRKHADVLLTYVTEAPAWKPSYRVVVGDKGKVMLEGWAIVDNVSGEDWKGVLVGVGASSALSFRYDLWSVRRIDRDLLQGEDRFAIAPPTGMSPYAESDTEELASLDSSEVRSDAKESQYVVDGVNTSSVASSKDVVPAGAAGGAIQGVIADSRTGEPIAGVTAIATSPALAQTQTAITDERGTYKINELPPGDYLVTFYYADITVERRGVHVGAGKSTPVFQKINEAAAGGETIHVKATAPTIDPTSTTQGITIDKNYLEERPGAGPHVGGRARCRRRFAERRDRYVVLGLELDREFLHASCKPPPPIKQGDDKLEAIAKRIVGAKKDVVIETHGASAVDANKRGEAVRNKLVDVGVPAKRIHVVPRVGPTEGTNVRVLAVAAGANPEVAAPPAANARAAMPDTPVGESHFMADRPMDVRTGSSAMVAMVHGETAGGVVYLYDPISDRGDKRFAFKAVRLDNPTTDTLEPGPVTVYGDGRFIGEGITEPVPPKASVVVPFALDREIVVSQNGAELDRIAKLVTAQRGVITAEVQHRRQTRFTITSRLDIPAKVFLRHRLESGWTLVEAPPRSMKVGDSQLFEVDLGPKETSYVTIAESTPLERSMQLSSDEALDMMRVYVDEPEASPALKSQIEALLATHRGAADLVDKMQTLREQIGEFRERAGELHAQIVTLKMVKTSGELMATLRTKLAETSEMTQKTTISIVDAQEQLMLARVKFGNQLAELHLEDATGRTAAAMIATANGRKRRAIPARRGMTRPCPSNASTPS